jgi:cytochrome b561
MGIRDGATYYGSVSVINHWLSGLLVVILLTLGLVFHDMPRSDEKNFLLWLHISIGSITLFVVLFRVVWRLREGFLTPLGTTRWQVTLARLTHWGLLLCVLIMVVSGLLIVFSTGRPLNIFNLISIPSPMARQDRQHVPAHAGAWRPRE